MYVMGQERIAASSQERTVKIGMDASLQAIPKNMFPISDRAGITTSLLRPVSKQKSQAIKATVAANQPFS